METGRMDTPPPTVLELVDLLHQEIAHLNQLAQVAAEERVALQRLSMPTFETVNERRVQTLELLQILEHRREVILRDLALQWGVCDEAVTISAVIERVGLEVSRTLQGQQREMDRLVDTVRQLMAVNRLAMTKLVDFIQQTLAVSQPPPGAETLYSEAGAKKPTCASGRMMTRQG